MKLIDPLNPYGMFLKMFARLIRRRKDRTDLFDWTKVSEVGATAFYLLQPEPVSA